MYSLLILGIFVPFQVIMIPITVMMSRLGLTNIWGLIILYLTYAVPQTLFLYVGYIKLSVPDSLDEAAEIDGADKFITYRKIVFPMLKPMHATTLIINALWFWNDFMLPLLMLNKSSDSCHCHFFNTTTQDNTSATTDQALHHTSLVLLLSQSFTSFSKNISFQE